MINACFSAYANFCLRGQKAWHSSVLETIPITYLEKENRGEEGLKEQESKRDRGNFAQLPNTEVGAHYRSYGKDKIQDALAW